MKTFERMKGGNVDTRKQRLVCVWALIACCFFVPSAPVLADSAGAEPVSTAIELSGRWRFSLDHVRTDGTASDFGRAYAQPGQLTEAQVRDRQGYGLEYGYHQVDFDDSGWDTIQVPGGWGSQGYRRQGGPTYYGPAWYRQRVFVPEEWRGLPIQLQLGQPNQRGVAFWNGKKVARIDDWGPHFNIRLLPEDVFFGGTNVIAVYVTNHYKEGGLTGGEFRLSVVRPFAPAAGFQPQKMSLSVDRNLQPDILSADNWRYGWRDEGTSDTRPRMRRADGAYHGRDAIAMEVWYPNSTEMVDFRLGDDENGNIWQARRFDYLAFWAKSEVSGEMQIRLNRGDIRWKRGGPSYSTRFFVEAGGWTRIILPFNAFLEKNEPLTDTSVIDTIVLGYGNNEMQGAGTVWFADFEVGHFDLPDAARPVSLDGPWFFSLDNRRPDGAASDFKGNTRDREGYGLDMGYHQSTFDHSGWDAIRVGDSWENQGYPNYDGPAWYRQRVRVPVAWKGRPLKLMLGKPDDRGTIFWNGVEVLTVEAYGPNFEVVISPEHVQYGEYNTIAVRIYDWYKSGGIMGSPFTLGPEGERTAVRWADAGSGTEVEFEAFDPGAKPPIDRAIEVVFRFIPGLATDGDLTLDYRLMDCFHAEVAVGTVPITAGADGDLEAVIRLTREEARRFYYGEWIDVRGMVMTAANDPVMSFSRHRLKMRYEQRDRLALPDLPKIDEDTPLGRLRLVDVIKPGEDDPDLAPHPYKEGGVRDFWGGRRAYSPWKEGVRVNEFQGRRYREANDSRNFGYRVGRGKMAPGTQYLLRILYPEDKTRRFVLDIKAGRNYQGVGFRTGTVLAPDDPLTPYPLSGEYQWSDHIVSLDAYTYGYRGWNEREGRTTSAEHGFWVFFHDVGRVFAPEYESGPAVAEIRLYEIENPEAHYPEIRYPEGLPRRVLMMDWERQPEANPEDVARYARLIGLNALGPLIQKWSTMAYWDTAVAGFGTTTPHWYPAVASRDPDDCERGTYRMWLEGTKRHGVTIIPRIEYGGSESLPREARVIGPDGRIDPVGRYASWGANLLHPATLEEFRQVMHEIVGREIEGYPNLGGMLWRMRSDRVKVSYGRHDVELFCRETGREMPEGDAAAIARWASRTVAEDYHEWWHAKRRDFQVQLRDILREYRPDLKLYYYNWDGDRWNFMQNYRMRPQDYTDLYNVNTSLDVYKRQVAHQNRNRDEDYFIGFREGRDRHVDAQHKQLRMALYQDVDGVVLFGPVAWHYLSDNEPYVQNFQTGDGLALCMLMDYEERLRTNIQNDFYESAELTPAGPQFSMATEVLSFFHGDPNVITWTPYTIGRSFITEHRRFAQAFLALPDMRGRIEADAVPAEHAGHVRVRTYPIEDGRVYVSVVHRGFQTLPTRVTLPGVMGPVRMIDLVTGETVAPIQTREGIALDLMLQPMELRSYRVEAQR